MALARTPDMPMKPDNLNINISAYRVLYILLLLVQYRSLGADELNRFLFENPIIQRAYNTETLTKYINTLREVGCEIPRSSSRNDYSYELLKSPFPLTLDADELQIMEKVTDLLDRQADELLLKDFNDLLTQLAWCADYEWPAAAEGDFSGNVRPFADLEVRKKALNRYRRYCQDAFTLEVCYRTERQPETVVLLIEPHEVMERGRQLLLLGTEQCNREKQMLEIGRIERCRQLPGKNKRTTVQTIVTFALYGRLAKSYRLYPGEKIVYQGENERHIKTKLTDTTELVNRLLKYGPSCQVLGPETLRATMCERIEAMLSALSSPLAIQGNSSHSEPDG